MTELVLHIGAPKCGSSALQNALSMTPELRGHDGTDYRYTASWPGVRGRVTVIGHQVTRHARSSPYGYATWSSLRPDEDNTPTMKELYSVLLKGRKGGYVPIASNEAWVDWPQVFADALADWGHPKITVVAFVRPVVEWVNAAYWQWAVWNVPNTDIWMQRQATKLYQFGPRLEAWAAIPNVKVIVRSQKPDVVTRFGQELGFDLPQEVRRNATLPPALLGFLLRNRQFRETAKDGEIEFIVQRWCPPVEGAGRLWIVKPKHLQGLRDSVELNRAAYERLMSPADYADLMSDPKWTREAAYHPVLQNGQRNVHELADIPPLYASLVAGVVAAGGEPPQSPAPSSDASLEEWDQALCSVCNALVRADHVERRKASKRFGILGF